MDVVTFIGDEMRKPFAWGETDCASTADRWVQQLRAYSPLDRYGRRPVNEASGRAWLAEPGGLLRGVRSVMELAGFPLIQGDPAAGDVGVIILGRRACVAIFDGSVWWSRDSDGFIAAADEHRYSAWRVS